MLFDGNGSESGGCNVLDQVQADCWTVCVAKSLGLRVAQAAPPLRYESVQTAFVPKTHPDAGLFLLLQAAELSREWQREIVVVQLREEGVRSRGSSSGLEGNETARCEPVLDGSDYCNL